MADRVFVPDPARTDAVRFRYRNYRDEVAVRHVVVVGDASSISFANTEQHPKTQLLLTAYDLDKQAERDFALADILPWEDTDG